MAAFNNNALKKISDGIQKGKALAPTAKIYLYGGHGADVCNKDTKEMLIETVPDDCIYVTVGECGRAISGNSLRDKLFTSTKEEDKQLIRDMFQSDAKLREFTTKANISPDSLHIHYPGMQYVVNNFYPVAIFDSKNGTLPLPNNKRGTALEKSGLIDKSKYEGLDPHEIHFQMLENYIDMIEKMTSMDYFVMRPYAIAKLKKIFEHSPHIVKLLDSKRAQKLFEETVIQKELISLARTKPFLEKLFYRYPKYSVIEQFSASVAPTPEEVTALLDKNRYSPNDLDALAKKLAGSEMYHFHHNSSSPFTNTNLMKRFPGIHFNFTCRDTSKECEAHTEMRRQESEQAATAIKTQMNKETSLGKDYDYVIQRVEEIQERTYKDLHAKRVALYNSLLSIKHILQQLSTYEKETVIKFLMGAEENLLMEDVSKRTLIQKKILHLLSPDKYSLQGGTRKRNQKKRNKSRKI